MSMTSPEPPSPAARPERRRTHLRQRGRRGGGAAARRGCGGWPRSVGDHGVELNHVDVVSASRRQRSIHLSAKIGGAEPPNKGSKM